MKKISKLFIGALVFTMSTVSCDLERFPHDNIEQTQAFQTLQDAKNLSSGLYVQLRNRIYGMYVQTTEIQSDWLNASIDFGNIYGAIHRLNDLDASDYYLRDIWSGYYSMLSNVNNFLDNIQRVETNTAAEAEEVANLTGEVHLMRALLYHQLVLRWGKPYDPATAATDLGVPLVLKFDVALRPSRATLAVVYQNILEDISEAKRLIPEGGVPRAERMTRDAAIALEVRVKLHMRDWTGVVAAAQPLISSNRYPLITTAAGLQQMWVNDLGSESIVQLFASLQELGAANTVYWGYNAPAGAVPAFFKPWFIPQQWIIDIYDDADHRKAIFLQPKPIRTSVGNFDNVYLFSKFPGNPALYSGTNTNHQHRPKVFRIAETHLNLAEAQYYINQDQARITLNALRVARNLPALTNNTDLLTHIQHERIRELVGEGFRLNDLMRWGMGVTRLDPQNSTFIMTGVDYDQLNVPAGFLKLVWGIPINELTTNPNIAGQQNPGW